MGETEEEKIIVIPLEDDATGRSVYFIIQKEHFKIKKRQFKKDENNFKGRKKENQKTKVWKKRELYLLIHSFI